LGIQEDLGARDEEPDGDEAEEALEAVDGAEDGEAEKRDCEEEEAGEADVEPDGDELVMGLPPGGAGAGAVAPDGFLANGFPAVGEVFGAFGGFDFFEVEFVDGLEAGFGVFVFDEAAAGALGEEGDAADGEGDAGEGDEDESGEVAAGVEEDVETDHEGEDGHAGAAHGEGDGGGGESDEGEVFPEGGLEGEADAEHEAGGDGAVVGVDGEAGESAGDAGVLGEAGGFVVDGGVDEEDGSEGGPVGDFAPVVGGEEGDAGEGDEPGGEEVHDEDGVFAKEVDIEAAEEGGIEELEEAVLRRFRQRTW
jgi:hypothetical protein